MHAPCVVPFLSMWAEDALPVSGVMAGLVIEAGSSAGRRIISEWRVVLAPSPANEPTAAVVAQLAPSSECRAAAGP